MNPSEVFELLLARLVQEAGGRDRYDVTEKIIIGYIADVIGKQEPASEIWEAISPGLRQWIVRDGHAFQWNFIRSVVQIRTLPAAEELQWAAELYAGSSKLELEKRIRSLSGNQFEHFLGTVLGRLPQFRQISITQASRDGGIDFRGLYILEHASPPFGMIGSVKLIGQAKQVSAPLPVKDARDFIGAIDLAHERRVVGLLVCTAGFTAPAREALENSSCFVIMWGMEELLAAAQSVIAKRVELSFEMPDETFWDELLVTPTAS